MSESVEKEIEGFRIGSYFVSFADKGSIINEDEQGRLYLEVDVFRIGTDESVTKLEQKEVTPDIEQMISDELSRILMENINTEGETNVR